MGESWPGLSSVSPLCGHGTLSRVRFSLQPNSGFLEHQMPWATFFCFTPLAYYLQVLVFLSAHIHLLKQ